MLNLIINRTTNSNINADGSPIYFARCEIKAGDRVVAMVTLQESSSEVLNESVKQLDEAVKTAMAAGGFRLVFLKDPGGVRDKSFTPYWSEKNFHLTEMSDAESFPSIRGTNNVFCNRKDVILN